MADMVDPIAQRVMYYERVKRTGRNVVQFLPFYTVVYLGQGSMIEPRDMLMERTDFPGLLTAAEAPAAKSVDDIRECDAKMSYLKCHMRSDTDIALHAFNPMWPG